MPDDTTFTPAPPRETLTLGQRLLEIQAQLEAGSLGQAGEYLSDLIHDTFAGHYVDREQVEQARQGANAMARLQGIQQGIEIEQRRLAERLGFHTLLDAAPTGQKP
jgi:hypothetical protein